jgi:copper homeostasis protein
MWRLPSREETPASSDDNREHFESTGITRVKFTVEVIACSVEDAREAASGGADRLEVVRDLDQDGLTPDVTLVEKILAAVTVPVRVMVRERNTFDVAEAAELKLLCRRTNEFSGLPIDGLVLGLIQNGAVDLQSMREVISHAAGKSITFHRAFDAISSRLRAIEDLKTLGGVDRILTSGGTGSWEQRIATMREYAAVAAPEIAVLAGGGLDAEIAVQIATQSSVREFHFGRAVRENQSTRGHVGAEFVNNIRKRLQGELSER